MRCRHHKCQDMVVSPCTLLIMLFPLTVGECSAPFQSWVKCSPAGSEPIVLLHAWHCASASASRTILKREIFIAGNQAGNERQKGATCAQKIKSKFNSSNYTFINTLFAIKMHKIPKWELQLLRRWKEGNWGNSASLSLACKILKKPGSLWVVIVHNLTSSATICKWARNPVRAAENL